MICPHCGRTKAPTDASFCPFCGEALRGPPCPACATPSEVDDRFCTTCGAAMSGIAADSTGGERATVGRSLPQGVTRGRLLGYIGFSVGFVAIGVLIAVTFFGGRDEEPGETSSPTPTAPVSSVDLSAMTPREAAIRLFNRVMAAAETGDRAEADFFLPMAIASFDRIEGLTLDDRFHLSQLHAEAGDGTSALAVAEAGLAFRSTHLFCLVAAARAALLLGDSAKARTYYTTLADNFTQEAQSGLAEYGTGEGGHANLLPQLQEEALAYLGER